MRYYGRRLGGAAVAGVALALSVAGAAWAAPSPGTITAYAGTGMPGYSGDNGPATSACLNQPNGQAVDGAGDIFVADTANNVVREVTSDGTIKTFAGAETTQTNTGNCAPHEASHGGYSGDNGPATAAQLNQPQGVAVDSVGDVFIADTNNQVVREVKPSGVISTVAGNGHGGYSGDGGPATSAMLNHPWGVSVDSSGNLFIADHDNQVVREVKPSGVISTVAGNGHGGYSGNGGPATSAMLNHPTDVLVSGSSLYIADHDNQVIRLVSAGVITTVAGNGHGGYSGDGGPATAAMLNHPTNLALDSGGNLLFSDAGNNVVRQVTAGTIYTLAGDHKGGNSGDGGSCTDAMLNQPTGVSTMGMDFVFSDSHNNRLRKCHYPNPVMAESHLPVALPLTGLALFGSVGVVMVTRRRRQTQVVRS